jgi:acetylornithine deacetylase/succinyl-diaminopimelate desuccinylase-like protein
MKEINRHRALSFLEGSIEYPHPQTDLNKVRAYIEEFVKPIIGGLPFDTVKLDDRGNLIAIKKGSGKDEDPLILCSYGGIFPADGMDDPNTPIRVTGEEYGYSGECVRGRGTSEQLSALAASLEGISTFFEEQNEIQRDLIWITNYAGEMGDHEAVSHIFIGGTTPLGPALLIMASNNTTCVGNLGRVDIDIHMHGQSCHSSDPSQGKNVIDGLVPILESLAKQANLPEDPDLGKATLAVTRISTWPTASHTIPSRLEMTLDRRLIPGEDPIDVMTAIIEALPPLPSGLSLSYNEDPKVQYPHKVQPDIAIARAAMEASEKVLGHKNVSYQRSALDMGFFSRHGVDAITFGPGDLTLAHSSNEFVSLDEYYAAAEVYLQFLRNMLIDDAYL